MAEVDPIKPPPIAEFAAEFYPPKKYGYSNEINTPTISDQRVI